MREKLIDSYEILYNNRHVFITLVEKPNKYITEKCLLDNGILKLLCKKEYKNLEEAINLFEFLKAH